MSRLLLLFCSGVLILLNFWEVGPLATSFEWLIATNNKLDFMRTSLAIVLGVYALLPEIAQQYIREVMITVGFIILPLGIATLAFHSYFQAHGYYIYPLETITFIEAGVIALLAGLKTTPMEADSTEPEFSTAGTPRLRVRRS